MESDQTAAPTKEELVLQELNRLMAESQANEQLVKDLEQLKETYVFRFQEISNDIGKIEQAANQISQHPSLNQNDKRQNLLKLEERKNALRQELSKRGEELLVTKRTLVINKLGQHMQKATEVQAAILDDIQQWRWEQQRSLCGWPQPCSLDGLQKLCEMQGEILWRLYQGINQMDSIFRPVIQNEAEVKRMDFFQNGIKLLLEVFLRRTFIIEKQPPQVLKKVTKFGAHLRLLVGGKNLKIHPPEVTCTVVTEKDINRYNLFGNRDKQKSGALPNNKNVLNNKKTMEYNQETNVLDVEFKNLSLTAADRQGGKNKDAVTDEKSSVLFSATLNLGKETFQVFTVSAPVCLTVHGNQAPDAEATIFWDNAFAVKGRTTLEVPDEIPWPRMAEALSSRWKLWNEVGLTQDHLFHLANKLFPGTTADELANMVVTKQLFNKDHLQGRQCTFWQWVYGTMDVVKRNMLNEWKDGNVIGFLSKQQSHDQLMQRPTGTFLLRFSDSEIGGVTVPYVKQCMSGQIAVWDLKPWTNRDFGMRKLSDRIKDIDELFYLFPEQKPKKLAFGDYYTQEGQ